MKLLKPLMLSLIAVTLMTGCEELGDVNFSAPFELPEPIEVTIPNTEKYELANASSIDAEENDEYKKYKGKIKKITINKISYTVTDFEGPDGEEVVTLTYANAFFNAAGQSNSTNLMISLQNVELSEGATGEFNAESAVLTQIADILLEDGVATVSFTAKAENAPVSFKLRIEVDAEVTANPL